MLARSGGEASEARMRTASRIDDLPVLFRPVIRLTLPNPSSLSCRSDRNRSMVSEEMLVFIDSSLLWATVVRRWPPPEPLLHQTKFLRHAFGNTLWRCPPPTSTERGH